MLYSSEYGILIVMSYISDHRANLRIEAAIRGRNRTRLSRTAIMLRSAKSSANRRGLEFNLDLSDIVIPSTCPVLGIPLAFTFTGDRSGTPSLDRIDNTKGYVKGNVAVISWRANRLKWDGTWQEHQQIADWTRKNIGAVEYGSS